MEKLTGHAGGGEEVRPFVDRSFENARGAKKGSKNHLFVPEASSKNARKSLISKGGCC